MSWSTSSVTPGYSSVKNKLLWTELKAPLSLRLSEKRNLACYSWSMQTIAKAETFLQQIKPSNISCEVDGYIHVYLAYLFTVILDAYLLQIQWQWLGKLW